MNKSPTLGELAKALAKAQSEMKVAVKDSENPFFKSHYADLGSVWDACRTALNSNGLSIVQTCGIDTSGPTLITTLLHSSGEWIEGAQPLNAKAQDPQALASAITYARRKGVAAIAGVVEADDDAEKAMGRDIQTNHTAGYMAPTQPAGQGQFHTCGNRMMVSKFKENMWYCGKCKTNVPMQTHQDDTDNIPLFEPPGYVK